MNNYTTSNAWPTQGMSFMQTNAANFRDYPVAPGTSIFLVDLNELKAVIKYTNGMTTNIIKEFDIVDVTPEISDTSGIPKKEFDDLKSEVNNIASKLQLLINELGGTK